jgi:hypothetical protein
MKRFLLAAALSVAALPAMADLWTLHQHKHWSVKLLKSDNGSLSCWAENSSANGLFSMGYSSAGLNDFLIMLPGHRFGPRYAANIAVWVDGRDPWLVEAWAEGESINWRLDVTALPFIEQVMKGNHVYIDLNRDGFSDAWFSLAGSTRAIHVYSDCMGRL